MNQHGKQISKIGQHFVKLIKHQIDCFYWRILYITQFAHIHGER